MCTKLFRNKRNYFLVIGKNENKIKIKMNKK